MKVLVEIDLVNPHDATEFLFNLRYASDVLDKVQLGVGLRTVVQDPADQVDLYEGIGKAKEIIGGLISHIESGGIKSFV